MEPFSVASLSGYISDLFEMDDLLADLWVEGEVSDVFTSRAGHVYFSLVDEQAKLKCVLFRNEAIRQVVLPRQGALIAVHGSIRTYERDGVYQLYSDVIQDAGVGLQALEFERLRLKLEAEGLFDPARKRPIPAAPAFIGVATSAEGAVWHDIQTVLDRRYPMTHVIFAPCQVQGDRAPDSIVEALRAIQDDGRAEVIILGRGGGSADDLAWFNDERVLRAVFGSRIPVVSAVGHESDWTLCDLVADLRAPTPSAAAELCSPDIAELGRRLAALAERLDRGAATALDERRERVDRVGSGLVRVSPTVVVEQARPLVESAIDRLRHGIDAVRLSTARDLEMTNRALRFTRSAVTMHRAATLATMDARLEAMAPQRVLERGYAMLSTADGAAIARVTDVSVGDELVATLADGTITGVVTAINATSPAKAS